jgi:2-dehydropantoate 2-reductase
MGGGCAVVPLLNGLAHLNRLDARFGTASVMGGTCGIDAMLLPDGLIRHTGAPQRIAFGERDRRRSARAETLSTAFARTSLQWECSDDISMRMWEKIVLLSALSATTWLFRGNVHEIMSAPGGREAAERLLAANVEIARREGYPQSEAWVRHARERLTDPDGRWSASMMRDLEGGRPVEADHVIGFMLARARAHGVDDTVLSLAFTHLKTYETRRAEGRLPGS